jgi:ABC-2 type transport system permease protein
MTHLPVEERPRAAVGDGAACDAIGAVATVYYWELRKLAAQKRTWLGILAAALTPALFWFSIQISKITPNDGPYEDPLGQGLHHSGLALLPVVLSEINFIGPAMLAALVAGDIVAGEDVGGTLKTILTRSVRRGQILAGKTLAVFSYIIAALIVYSVFGTAVAVAGWGFHPLANISGHTMSASQALGLTLVALAVYLVPVLALASFGLFLSVIARQSVAAVIGTIFYVLALQGINSIHAFAAAQPYNLVVQLKAWQGVFKTPADGGAIVHSLWLSLIYIVVPLAAAALIFKRRDVAS